uniref:Chromosome partitioning protein n=1 Tax=Gracilinema caldarium TaxID=215591 RepID=A0A7C3I1S8_9SPIR
MEQMERRPEDLFGMDPQEAKAYIAAHLASLKLTEKKRAELEADLAKWMGRIELARSKGAEDLALEAEKAAERVRTDLAKLQAEEAELRAQIDVMRRQLPGLSARQRTVDPDLLEQELLMASGRLPGDEAAAETERNLAKLEKESKAAADLAALKAKLTGSKGENPGGAQ